MKKFLLCSALGLLIVSGFSITTSANVFTLRNYQTGLCLGIAAGNLKLGTALVTWTCDGTPSQQWAQIIQSDAYFNTPSDYLIVNTYSSNFVPPDTSAGTQFFFLSSGLATITYDNNITDNSYGAISNSVIGTKAGALTNGTPLIEWSEEPNPHNNDINQIWYNEFVGNDLGGHRCYIFHNWGAGLVMGVQAGNPNRGTPVVIWQLFLNPNGNGKPDYVGHPDQTWCVY